MRQVSTPDSAIRASTRRPPCPGAPWNRRENAAGARGRPPALVTLYGKPPGAQPNAAAARHPRAAPRSARSWAIMKGMLDAHPAALTTLPAKRRTLTIMANAGRIATALAAAASAA